MESQTVLATNRWYDLVVHGRNGVSQQQQLYIYDGQTDALLERLDLTLTVAGTFRNRLTKWGFGTSQDSTGLEYYLDDIFHARGPTNPGPVRVFTRTAIGTQATGFSAVGAPSGNAAVDDCAPDADATYIASAADAGAHSASFTLAPAPLSAGNGVYAVQMFSIGRSAIAPVPERAGRHLARGRRLDESRLPDLHLRREADRLPDEPGDRAAVEPDRGERLQRRGQGHGCGRRPDAVHDGLVGGGVRASGRGLTRRHPRAVGPVHSTG